MSSSDGLKGCSALLPRNLTGYTGDRVKCGTVISTLGNLVVLPNTTTPQLVTGANGVFGLSSAVARCNANSLQFTQNAGTYVVMAPYSVIAAPSNAAVPGEKWSTTYSVYPLSAGIGIKIMWGTNAGNYDTVIHNNLTPNQWNTFTDVLTVPATLPGGSVNTITRPNIVLWNSTNDAAGYVDCFGTWKGDGGTYSPPGAPIYTQ
jgi:hypothetical protein